MMGPGPAENKSHENHVVKLSHFGGRKRRLKKKSPRRTLGRLDKAARECTFCVNG